MCGIAGYIGKIKPANKNILNTSKVLHHRGPDGEGFFAHNNDSNAVVLIHRRLSIIDLDKRSDQPFHYKGTVLIFNGEIYNYIEIRKELENMGHIFLTKSDTEVLIHSLYEWGDKALQKLEGMWAFAWYNKISGTMLLARDRFAEKPLYTWQKHDGLYFSSELKGIAALSGEWPQINESHLLRGLINGYKSLYKVNDTYFKEINEIPSSSFIKINSKKISEPKKYWFPSIKQNKNLSYEDSVEMIKETIINAVKIRMRSDVPIAFCMSGGIDSNTLISIASKILKCNVHGFTIVNSDSRYEEKNLVDQSVKELGIKHTEISINKINFIQNLTKQINFHDSPISTISYYLHWQLMQSVAEHGFKVTISGTAADELFSGYYDHHNLFLYEMRNHKNYSEFITSWKIHQSELVRNPYLKDPEIYIKNNNFRDHIYLNSELFANWLKKNWHESFTEVTYTDDLLRNRMLNEMFHEAVPVILREDDLNAMSYSLENRSPFLDSNLFEKANSIPTQYLIRDGKAKSVLRDSMKDIVPSHILNERRKVGFNAPVLDLIDLSNHETRNFLLDDSRVYELISKSNIEKLLNIHNMENSYSKFLFNFINMKIFMDTYK